jgi:hypothetical protein
VGFFFHRKSDLSIFGPIRIAYATLLLINVLTWWPDLEKWFGESGVLTLAVAISDQVIDPDTVTIFEWLPTTPTVLWTCYLILIANAVALVLGLFTRCQLISIFVLYTSFVHRNILIFDGEDVLFRLFAFYLLFAPAGQYRSIESWWRSRKTPVANQGLKRYPIWPLRLIQIQTASIVFFSAFEKLKGTEWFGGTAIYYVSRLDDMFCRFPVPEFIFKSLILMAIISWATLVLELGVPVAVWFEKTRRAALILVFLFHLSLDYMMNLNLFQWMMMVGWMSFIQPQDVALIRKTFGLGIKPEPPRADEQGPTSS